MANADAFAQYFLELINRARLDPAGEAARHGVTLNQGLAAGTITAGPKQVLAFDAALGDAASAHSAWMLQADVFSHTGLGGTDPGDRMASAGFDFGGGWGENIAWHGPGQYSAQDAEIQHRMLFLSALHRANVMNGGFDAIGIGSQTGDFTSGGTTYRALMTTQDFASSGTDVSVTGVAYADRDEDRFYSIGEGRGGRLIEIVRDGSVIASGTTAAAGGYGVATQARGLVDLRFSGGTLSEDIGIKVRLGAENIKVDLVDDRTILTNVSARLTGETTHLTLIGIADANATGTAQRNVIHGNAGDNTLSGLDGADSLHGASGNDTLVGGLGADRLSGDRGDDVFVFGSIAAITGDQVVDFRAGRDRIDLSGIDAVAGGSDQAFRLVDAFDGAGSLIVLARAGRTLVRGDADGDGSSDFSLWLAGQHRLSTADFIL